MNNFEQFVYTYKHRKMLIYLAKKYYDDERLIKQLNSHDMDKMYLLLFYNKKDINSFHRLMSRHHDNSLEKTKLDYIEMILDWESARYTKDDKPLNAYDTLIKFYPHLKDEILPLLKEMGLDKSTLDKEEDVDSYAKRISKVTEKDIKKELTDYIKSL